jgi:hypothetical protein
MNGLRKSAAAILILASVGGLIACGGSGSKKQSRVPTEPSAASTDTPGEKSEEPKSPRAAVSRLLEYLQSGAVLNAVLVYDTRVRDAIGTPNLAGTLATFQDVETGPKPIVLKVESTPIGSLVTVRWVAKTGPSTTSSYLVRRNGQRWVIVYDSRLAANLAGYVTARTQLAIDPNALPGQRSPKATAAGQRAADKYRDVALGSTPLQTRRTAMTSSTDASSPAAPGGTR